MPLGCIAYLRGSHSVRLQPRETWNRNMKMFLLVGTLPEASRRFQKFPEGFQKLHTFYVDVPVNLDLACFRNISRTREYMPLRDGFFSTATQTSCCNRIQRSNRVRLLVVSTHDFPDSYRSRCCLFLLLLLLLLPLLRRLRRRLLLSL